MGRHAGRGVGGGETAVIRMDLLGQRCRQNPAPCLRLLLIFLLLSSFVVAGQAAATVPLEGQKTIEIRRGRKQIAVFKVETVSDEKKRMKGLAGSPPLPENSGMLFLLDSTVEQYFWMKGMEFPLDILFFDKENRLLEILPDLLPCEECLKYKAPANTASALEINAGMAGALGIERGDVFVFTGNESNR